MPRHGPRPICTVEGCGRPNLARGLCSLHYTREPDRKAYAKTYRVENRARVLETQRACRVRKKYGLSLEEYDAIIARGCAICGSHEKVCLDHDHSTGANRDALCTRCNSALGYLRDDPDLARQAGTYLEGHRAPKPA